MFKHLYWYALHNLSSLELAQAIDPVGLKRFCTSKNCKKQASNWDVLQYAYISKIIIIIPAFTVDWLLTLIYLLKSVIGGRFYYSV